jgi:hypothetical protein
MKENKAAEEFGARIVRSATWCAGAATVLACAYWLFLILTSDGPLSRSDWTLIVIVLLLWRILLSLHRLKGWLDESGHRFLDYFLASGEKSKETRDGMLAELKTIKQYLHIMNQRDAGMPMQHLVDNIARDANTKEVEALRVAVPGCDYRVDEVLPPKA